ncbi:MAG: Ig-like domain-containing protein [Firmicutes bacterium]|nr:Ig-like domain-containing protein [Bacillota bacterium]
MSTQRRFPPILVFLLVFALIFSCGADIFKTVVVYAADNNAPIANSDEFTVAEGSTHNGVVSAEDPDDDPITFMLATGPSRGTLVFNANGSFSYTAHRQPTLGFIGVDSFSFVANDGKVNSEPATVTINITPTNDPPQGTPNAFTVNAGETHSGAVNAADSDGDALTYSLVSAPSKGTVILNADGAFSYTAHLDSEGNDSFTFTANDGLADSNPTMVDITIIEAIIENIYEVWVDDDFDSETMGWGTTHFDTIQDGIDVVETGGIVNVAAGTYLGANVYKADLMLRGQSGAIIDGSSVITGFGYIVSEPGVTIEGFTIQNWDDAGILLTGDRTAHNSTVQNNTLTGNRVGILVQTNGNSIFNNIVTASTNNGIEMYGNDNTVSENTVTDNTTSGIYINGTGNTVADNTAEGNGIIGNWISCGIFIEGDNNTITENIANNNRRIGIRILGNENIVSNNSASNNGLSGGWRGIHLEGNDNQVLDNIVNGNNSDGIEFDSNSSGNIIRGNTVNENRDSGISVRGTNYTISENTTINNGQTGIQINTRDSGSNIVDNITERNLEYGIQSSGANLVRGNIVTGNGNIERGWTGGILASEGDVIYLNSIFDNINYGIYTYHGWVGENPVPDPDVEPLQAIHNWWGHASGPFHDSTNLYGLGNQVAENISYSPWLLAPHSAEPANTKTEYLNDGETAIIEAGVSAIVMSGSGSVTVGEYTSNPAAKSFYGSVGKYVDVYVTSPHNIDELLVKLFYEGTPEKETDLVMYWWDGSDWAVCSNTGVNIGGKYVWAIITADTSPLLSDLTGTEFGAGLIEVPPANVGPVEPEEPTEPAEPVEPEEPTDPEEPKEEDAQEGGELPQTGGNPFVLFAGLLISTLGLFLRKKQAMQ